MGEHVTALFNSCYYRRNVQILFLHFPWKTESRGQHLRTRLYIRDVRRAFWEGYSLLKESSIHFMLGCAMHKMSSGLVL